MIKTLNNYVLCIVIFTKGMDKVNHEYNYMTTNSKYNNFSHLYDYRNKIMIS